MANEKIAIEIFAALTNQLINQSINFNENDLVMITDINQLDLTKQYNYADYLTWQFQDRVELIKGWIKKMSGPTYNHQHTLTRLMTILNNYFWDGPCEFVPAPLDV